MTMNKSPVQPPIILMVEDSDEDFYATQRAFRKAGMLNELYRCVDGQEALDYLYHQGAYTKAATAPMPNLMLLDLNLPKKDGREVLKVVKGDARFQALPVIILTTSDDQTDVEQCYQYGANSYVQKPVDLDRFMTAIRRLKDYWFEVAILPKRQ